MYLFFIVFFFFQAEDGIRDLTVTGVQTCALPISPRRTRRSAPPSVWRRWSGRGPTCRSGSCGTCWSSSTAWRSPLPTAPTSPGSPRWPAGWRGRSGGAGACRELRAAAPAARPRRAPAVVVVARPPARGLAGHPHERRATLCGSGGAAVGRPATGHAAERVSGRLDRRRGGATRRGGAQRDAQRGDLDRPVRGLVEQHAR